jgi:glycolate oxidase FAD binding subunit
MGTSSTQADTSVQEFEAIVGASRVTKWESMAQPQRDRLSRALFPKASIACVVEPANVTELTAVIACAHQHRLPILPQGGGSKLDWGGLVGKRKNLPATSPSAQPLIVVSTAHLNQLLEHAVGDLTVTVEAGMKFAELQAILATQGQFLAIDPAFPDQATIGGIVATADTGSLRQRYNSVRDMLLGVSIVRADGQVAKAGGRVVKNVAGYDLMKLLTGSYGTLGVISQVTFRVYPLPEASQSIVLSGAGTAIAQAVQTILKSALTPISIDVLSSRVTEILAAGQGIGLAVRFQSLLPSIQEQATRLVELGQALGLSSISYTDAEATTLWQRLREQMCPASPSESITCKIGIRPSQAIALLDHINDLNIPAWSGQIYAASGLGLLVIHDSTLAPDLLFTMRNFCQANGGFLSVLQAPVSLKQQIDVWGYPGNAIVLMQKIKRQFDPEALLSPGRFLMGI